MKNTISIITATYNFARFLPDCLQSVKKSVLAPLDDWEIEHIVVDDGSSDGTQDLFRENIEGVNYMRLDNNGGAAAARNIGIEKSKGDYIFVLDADDILTQRALYYLVHSLESNNKFAWVCCDMLRVNQDLTYRMGDDYYGWQFDDCRHMLQAIMRGEHFIQHNVMFSRELFYRVGGYDESLKMAQDLDLWIRFLLADEMPVYLPIISHLHRFHDNNMSKGCDNERHMRVVATFRQKYAEELREKGINI